VISCQYVQRMPISFPFCSDGPHFWCLPGGGASRARPQSQARSRFSPATAAGDMFTTVEIIMFRLGSVSGNFLSEGSAMRSTASRGVTDR
jgi:hypothetical protein